MSEGVDYAWGRPGAANLVAAGKRFVMRYVPYNSGDNKGLSVAEKNDLLSHGLSIGMVWEVFAGDALRGWQKGVDHGRGALYGMRSLGFPDSMPIYFAVDVDAYTTSQLQAVDAYLRGAGSVVGMGRVGVYGGVRVIDHCAVTGSARWFWQTYAWSGGRISTRTQVYQYDNYGNFINGAAVDLNKNFRTDFGQYPRPGTTSTVPSTSTSTSTVKEPMPMKLADGKHQVLKSVRIKRGATLYANSTATVVHDRNASRPAFDADLIEFWPGAKAPWLCRRRGGDGMFMAPDSAIDRNVAFRAYKLV